MNIDRDEFDAELKKLIDRFVSSRNDDVNCRGKGGDTAREEAHRVMAEFMAWNEMTEVVKLREENETLRSDLSDSQDVCGNLKREIIELSAKLKKYNDL